MRGAALDPLVRRGLGRLLGLFILARHLVLLRGEDGGGADPEPTEEGPDPTKDLLKELTIDMAGEVIDGRTFMIRPASSKATKQTLRLGNLRVAEDKEEEAKEALAKVVEKQMVFWKAAPPEQQPAGEDAAVTIVDAWTMKGSHLPKLLLETGHFTAAEDYQSELARDILSAEAEAEKQESYKQLEEALRESEKERRRAAKEAREKEKAENVEPIGLGGWIGIAVVVILVVGAATNFGRGFKAKSTNPNRKRGPVERFWMKLKGS